MTSSSRCFLDQFKIGPRLLFVSNLFNQSSFKDVRCRIAINMITTDVAMNKTFWVGVYHGLYKNHLNCITEKWKNLLLMVFK